MNPHVPHRFTTWPDRSQLEELDLSRRSFQEQYVCQFPKDEEQERRPGLNRVFRELYQLDTDTRRGTGKTLALLQLLPECAVFVIQNERMRFHVKVLCEKHGVDKPYLLVTPRWFVDQCWRGNRVIKAVVFDHDLSVTETERMHIDKAKEYLAATLPRYRV